MSCNCILILAFQPKQCITSSALQTMSCIESIRGAGVPYVFTTYINADTCRSYSDTFSDVLNDVFITTKSRNIYYHDILGHISDMYRIEVGSKKYLHIVYG